MIAAVQRHANIVGFLQYTLWSANYRRRQVVAEVRPGCDIKYFTTLQNGAIMAQSSVAIWNFVTELEGEYFSIL
jgi:hypothetical protein